MSAREVREASVDTLLTAFAALTHIIHEADRDRRVDLQRQRDEIRDEIKRRVGEA